MRINKWLDLIDRVGWTAIQSSAGALLIVLTEAGVTWESGAKVVAVATVIAVLKVVIAQQVGRDDLGAAVPGHVIESR